MTDPLKLKEYKVGNKTHLIHEDETFHDFLFKYIKYAVNEQWGIREMRKPYKKRHPIMQVYTDANRQFKERNKNGVVGGKMTGAMAELLSLSYDLFLLDKNKVNIKKIIERLRHRDKGHYQGARYEIYCAAVCIRANYKVNFLNQKGKDKVCDFEATHITSRRTISVEVKSRGRPGYLGKSGEKNIKNITKAGISSLINQSMLKVAKHERVIFIEVNLPAGNNDWPEWIYNETQLSNKYAIENNLGGAMVILTNVPYHYNREEIQPRRGYLLRPINIQPLTTGCRNSNMIIRFVYPHIYSLIMYLIKNATIPIEFPA